MESDSFKEILFQWRPPASQTAQRVVIAIIAAISIHVFCFYVFQVQEPQSRRTLPQTIGITYLSPEDPASRLRLQQIDDFYAAYGSTLMVDSPLNMPLPPLDYEPSYARFTPTLMPLPELPISESAQQRQVYDSIILPPLVPEDEATVSSPTGLVLTEGLRLILPRSWDERYAGSPGVDWVAVSARVGDPGRRLSWRVFVRPSGGVERVESLDTEENLDLKEAVRSLTFTPFDGESSVAVEMHFQW